MKALVVSNKEEPLRIEDWPDPVPTGDSAIVSVHSAALNHRDSWIRKGQYAGLKYPIVLGSDGSGIVLSVGDARYKDWIGKEVIIYPAIGWGDQNSHQHPTNFKILGLPDHGTLGELVLVPLANVFAKPAHLSFNEAAALPLAGVTAYRALLKRAELKPGEKVLITGIGGGVALFALQFALAIKAEVFVSSGNEEKLTRAIQLGAKNGVNYKLEGWSETLKTMAGQMDVILDGAGGNSVNQLLDIIKPGGRLVFYGSTNGPAHGIEIRRIFWKQLNVLGSTMGSPAEFEEMLAFVGKHELKPIIDKVFPFEQGEQAMKRMDDAKQFGKIVIQMK